MKPLLTLFFLLCGLTGLARQVIPLNDNWTFYYAYDVQRKPQSQPVTLPHTFNANDTHVGQNYFRGPGNYRRSLAIPAGYVGKRFFLYFEGVNAVADVWLDNQWIGQHTGGYTAFCFEVTNRVKPGTTHTLFVQANNAPNLGVLPLAGDFNVYGGIHRPVSLLVTEANCISPLDFASTGVYLRQSNVSAQSARVVAETLLSGRQVAGLTVLTRILDASGKEVARQQSPVQGASVRQPFTLLNPHLWNGKADPYQYRVLVSLRRGNTTLDEVEQPLGLRFFRLDPARGFFLNGQYLDLHGVCRHEDRQGKGSALSRTDYEDDMTLLRELGVTALRLTHYPQGKLFYDLCDKEGLILWTEIPFVGPGGYTNLGYVNSPALHRHARQVMTELIRQQFNHPSICFWGLMNELKQDYDNPDPFLRELNALVKKEDDSRLTTCATFLADSMYQQVSDAIGWNKYYGWYGGKAAEMGSWADNFHRLYPNKPMSISEYGAGGSIRQHDDTLRAVNPSSRWHPEGWQAYYHEENWNQLRQRPYIWGKFIWVFADFGSPIRAEGDTIGVNDKGLVTYDRRVKKDAFYFYKSHWNPTPMVYIADRRHTRRKAQQTDLKVYANSQLVELLVNGVSQGRQTNDGGNVFRWPGVRLAAGTNQIVAIEPTSDKQDSITIEWRP